MAPSPGDRSDWLDLAREFLRTSALTRVRLEEAAAAACMSPFHFHRSFTRTFGETPHQFVTRVRVDRAKALLAGTNLSVLEVCLAVGYQSVGTFSRRFAALVGRSPSDYREGVRPVLVAVPPTPGRHLPRWRLRPWRTLDASHSAVRTALLHRRLAPNRRRLTRRAATWRGCPDEDGVRRLLTLVDNMRSDLTC